MLKEFSLFVFLFSSTTNVELNVVFFSNFLHAHMMIKNFNKNEKLCFVIRYDV